MSEDEIADISHAMSHLGSVDSNVVSSTIERLDTELSESKTFHGDLRNTERLLEKAMDKDRVSMLMDNVKGPRGRDTWEKLSNVNEELLALYFRNEHPQTAALVLSKITPEHAAKVLSNLPDSFAFEIISRILNIGSVKKEILERVEKILRVEFISSIGKTQQGDSCKMLAEIFNNLDRHSEGKFMSMLESDLPDEASKIKDMMFTFSDIVKIDPKGIQKLLRDIEKARLTLALKGAPEEVKEVFFSNMSQRASKIMKDDMASLGSVRVKDVDIARGDIVALAKQLIESGEIDIAVTGDDEFIT